MRMVGGCSETETERETMAKPSQTSQFDAIQARLEAAGLAVRRSDRFDVRAELMLLPPLPRCAAALAVINIERKRDKTGIEAWSSIYGVYSSADPCNTPDEALASLLAKPFGRTTIGAVFGITPDPT